MLHNTRLESICAEAQRFPQPPPEAAAELAGLRPAAADLASALTRVPGAQSSPFFALGWKSLKATPRL